MKKTKKLLSIFTALTITASAFAGLAIPASAADTEYLSDDLNLYTATGINAQGNAGQTATLGKLELAMGARGSGGDGTSIISMDKDGDNSFFKIVSGKYATSSRGASISFASAANIPAFADIEEGNVLQLAFDAKFADAASTIQLYGVTSDDVTTGGQVVNDPYLSVANNSQIATGEWLHVSVNVAKDKKGYATITDKDGKLVSAKSFEAVGDAIGKIAFYGAATTVYMDNFAVKQTANTYADLTVNVKTNDDANLEDATVKIDRATETTDADGNVKVSVPQGTYAVEASKLGYEATEGQEDAATASVTMEGTAKTETLTINKQVYTPVPATVTMSGGQKVMTAPHALNATTSAAYELTVKDQKDVEITDAEITWTVLPTGSETADPNVTIADGVVSVAKGFTAGDTHVKNFTVTATAALNGESKSATATVDISDYLFYEPGVGGSSYGKTNVSGGFIASPATKDTTEKIVLPDPITFTPGTAQLLSFQTAVNNATAYTFKRTVTPTDKDGKAIVSLGYINLDIGDAETATWSSSSSSFATIWGSMSAINTWVDVTLLFKTNSNGETKVKMTVAGNEYDLGVTEATGLASIDTRLEINAPDRYVLLKDIIVSEVDVTGMEVDGPDKFSSVEGQTVTKNYAVDAMVIEDGEEFEWSTDIAGATITADANDSQKAVLSVPGTVVTGGKVTVKSKDGTATNPKNASLDVTIEPAAIKSATVNGSATLDKSAGTAAYTVSDVIDQFGDDVTDYFAPAWSVKAASQTGKATFTVNAEEAGTAVAIKAEYNEDNTLKNVTTEDIALTAGENTIEVEAPAGTKVMLWDKLNGMKPLAGMQTATAGAGANAEINAQTGELTITDNGDVEVIATFTHGDKTYPFSRDVKIATFSIVKDATENSTTVDVSELVADASIRGYRVTTATAEKALVKTGDIMVGEEAGEGAVATLDGTTLTVDTTGAAKVEVAPIFVGSMNKEYMIPGDTYNVTVTANNGARTDVYANDQMIFNNINQGSDNWTIARIIPASADYTAGDVVISKGSVKFTYADDKSGGTTIDKVTFAKAPSIVERAKRVYVIGDSLTAKYYGDAPAGKEQLVRTGWGDVLGDYLADGVEITNLGNSGAWAQGMLGDAFTNVRDSGQEGDILVLESGYNDSSHTSMEIMRESVKAMVRGAEANGMTVFVVTPNSSSHSSNEYLGSVKSTGDMIRAYNELKEEGSNAILIDLAAKSGFFFKSYYGDATYFDGEGKLITDASKWIIPSDAVLKAIYNNSGDSLHSSYNAANCWAAVVANGILENTATADVINEAHEYTFNDGTNNITVSAAKISNPAYVDYDITFTAADATVTRPNGTAITKAAAGDTVKVVVAEGMAPSVAGASAVEVKYDKTTNAYYFTMPAEAVTITVAAAPASGGEDTPNE